MSVVELITGFLGGGILGGIISTLITIMHSSRVAKKERRIRFLDDQIRELYGPLFRLIVQSEKLFELNQRVHDAYKKEYIQKNYVQDDIARERLREETSETIEIANDYVRLVTVNNQKIMELVDTKYSFIDPDDIDCFQLFFEHYIRHQTEFPADGKLRTPFMVYEHLGDISFLPPDFMSRIKGKFRAKKPELDDLSHS